MKIVRSVFRTTFVAALCLSPAVTVAQEPTVKEANEALGNLAEHARLKKAAMTFDDFKASIFKEPGPSGKYIVNGDTPIANEKHLREFYDKNVKNKPVKPSGDAAELIVNAIGGLNAVWSNSDKRRLTYCVSKTFAQDYILVVAAMQAATRAWEVASDVDFLHLSAEDIGCTMSNNNVLFDVRPVNLGEYLARAFFPGESRTSRNVLIDASSFALDPNSNLTLTGILRHELGHALAFRHEHTRPDSGTCFEDNNWNPLTDYDAFSVMHYPQCNGQGDWSLTLTELDKNGAACLYGPAAGFTIDASLCTSTNAAKTQTKTFVNQMVIQGAESRYGPFSVKPDTPFIARIEGTGIDPGDPDLYVKFDALANVADFDCRPFLTGADEACDVDVPAGRQAASIMVHGFAKGSYTLTVTHTAPN